MIILKLIFIVFKLLGPLKLEPKCLLTLDQACQTQTRVLQILLLRSPFFDNLSKNLLINVIFRSNKIAAGRIG